VLDAYQQAYVFLGIQILIWVCYQVLCVINHQTQVRKTHINYSLLTLLYQEISHDKNPLTTGQFFEVGEVANMQL